MSSDDLATLIIIAIVVLIIVCVGIRTAMANRIKDMESPKTDEHVHGEHLSVNSSTFKGDLAIAEKKVETHKPVALPKASLPKRSLPNIDSDDSVVFMSFDPKSEKDICCKECGTIVDPLYDRCFVCAAIIVKRG